MIDICDTRGSIITFLLILLASAMGWGEGEGYQRPSCIPLRTFRSTYPVNTGHSPNAVSMLAQRRRRCANIETALGECPVFAGIV